MLIVAYRTDPWVVTAVQTAITTPERQHEVAILVRTPRAEDLALREAEVAAFVVLDLRVVDIRTALRFATTTLHANPFAKVVVVAAAQTRVEEQTGFFDLGRAGIAAVPLPKEAEQSRWWCDFVEQHIVFDVITSAQQTIAAMIPPGERGELLLRIAQLAHVPSVKRLADRLYPYGAHSTAYKRRRLWEECRRLQIGTPESVLAAARLQLLKLILDTDLWTPSRVARYFGADTARNFSRSCKTRYGWSLRAIRSASREAVFEKVKAVYRADAPWVVASTN